MKRIGFVAVCSAFALAAVGCGDDGGRDRPDSSIVLEDSGTADTGTPDTDAGPGVDGGPILTGCDLVGIECSPDRGCRTGECESRLGEYPLGGPSDPIQGHPDGEDTVVMGAYFPNGYCTPNPLNYVNSGGCDPSDETSCGDCATCLNLGADSTGQTLSMCFKNCEPSLTENTCPQDDQDCSLGSGVCIWGCGSDDECAIHRPDTNGNGEIDPYDATENPGGDHLVYDTAGNWTCNTTTNRCEHDTPDGAEAGIPCEIDSECENYGRCIDEINYDFPGGYCLKFGCNVADNECEGDGVCDSRAFGDPVCLAPCEVGATATEDDPYSDSRDCRAGYSCFWNGADAAGADNGVCIPGNYNDVRTANTGATCSPTGDAEECHSPFGMGQCRDWDGDGPGGGYCTLFDCAAPGLDSDTICGDGAICASVAMSVTTLCMQTCDSAEDCTAGYGCWDTTPAGITTGGESICFAGCMEDGHCRSGQTCVGGSATTLGQCE